jgi:hypothetical protein
MPFSIFPSLFLPPISYFALLLNAENAVVDIYEHYQKQTCRNRCFIYAANGIMPMALPVHKIAHHTPIKDIKIAYESNWQATMWRSIISAYGSSPFFSYYDYLIEPVFKQQTNSLSDYNTQLTTLILKLLKSSVELNFSKSYIDSNDNIDYRNYFGKHYRDNNSVFINYHQPFEEKYGFQHDLSIIDLLFNEGPNSLNYINQLKLNTHIL